MKFSIEDDVAGNYRSYGYSRPEATEWNMPEALYYTMGEPDEAELDYTDCQLYAFVINKETE